MELSDTVWLAIITSITAILTIIVNGIMTRISVKKTLDVQHTESTTLLGEQKEKLQEIHVLVNGRLSEALARIAELEAAAAAGEKTVVQSEVVPAPQPKEKDAS